MLKRSAIKPGKGFAPRAAGLKSNGFAKGERKEVAASSKAARGMKTKRPAATADEKRHMAAVAALGCILCQHLEFGPTPAEVHHVRERHGWGRSGHFATIPLCPVHHRGQPFGVHDMGREEFTARYGISEMDLLGVVRIRLGLDFVKPKSEAANGLQPAAASKQITLEQ
jgi:hypothetical protein